MLDLELGLTVVGATSDDFGVRVSTHAGVAVLRVSGAVDMVTAPQLRRHVDDLLREGSTALVIDLSDVLFLASAGMEVLLYAAEAARPGTAVAVVADGPTTSRPMRLIGLDEMIDIHSTLAAALDGVAG